MVLHIPADEVEEVRNVFYRGAAPLAALDELTHQPLVVALLTEPVEHHQRAGRAAGVLRGLLVCLEVGENVERLVAGHVVVVVKDVVARVVMIRFPREGGRAVLA